MVEQYSVPEGPLYPPSSFGPGFGPCHRSSAFIKAEDKMGEILPAYRADTPPEKYRVSSSDWSNSYLDLSGCWCDDVNCPVDESIGNIVQSNMYDFDNILTPDMTPPHHDFSQSDCMDDINEVLSSLSTHSSLSELPFSADNLDVLLPTYSPTLPDMSVVSPPPIIHPHTKLTMPLASPPPANSPHKPSVTCTPCKYEQESSSPLPACSISDKVAPRNVKRKSSTNASGTSKKRRLTEPRKQRKREQNKAAALKYRSRKKQEKLGLDKQQTTLECENAELRDKVKSAEEEIAYLKSMLHEVCASSSITVSDSM